MGLFLAVGTSVLSRGNLWSDDLAATRGVDEGSSTPICLTPAGSIASLAAAGMAVTAFVACALFMTM
eukprot:276020-Amphidinium_carterae.1